MLPHCSRISMHCHTCYTDGGLNILGDQILRDRIINSSPKSGFLLHGKEEGEQN